MLTSVQELNAKQVSDLGIFEISKLTQDKEKMKRNSVCCHNNKKDYFSQNMRFFPDNWLLFLNGFYDTVMKIAAEKKKNLMSEKKTFALKKQKEEFWQFQI